MFSLPALGPSLSVRVDALAFSRLFEAAGAGEGDGGDTSAELLRFPSD